MLTTHVPEYWNLILLKIPLPSIINFQANDQRVRDHQKRRTRNNYTGGFDIEKISRKKIGDWFSWAEFKIAISESNNANNKIFFAGNGNSYAEDANLLIRVNFLASTSQDANGHVTLMWISFRLDRCQ